MTAPIAIQSPHIDPGIFQRSSGGGESGLEPLIAALQFYKKSKLEEQKNQIDAVRAGGEANFYNAHADEIRNNIRREQEIDDAWDKQIGTAPAVLQPFLRFTSAARALPPELQHVASTVAAQNMIPGVKPEQVTQMQGYMRLGLDTGSSAKLAGISVYDLADTKNPHDPNAIGLPKNILDWRYTPPGAEARADALAFRAQNAIVNEADKDDKTVQQTLAKAKEDIAQAAWKAGNPKAPAPLVPVHYNPNDPNQVLALHKFVAQHHLDTRMQLNAQNRAAAKQRINARGLGPQSDSSPTGDRIQQILNLMQQAPDSTLQ